MAQVLTVVAIVVAIIFGVLTYLGEKSSNTLGFQQAKIESLRSLREEAIEFKRWSIDEMMPTRQALSKAFHEGEEDTNNIGDSYGKIITEQKRRYLILVDQYYSTRGYFSGVGKSKVDESIASVDALSKELAALRGSEASRGAEIGLLLEKVMDHRSEFAFRLAEVCQSELDIAYEEVRRLTSVNRNDQYARVVKNLPEIIASVADRDGPIPAQFSLEPARRYVPVSEIFSEPEFPAGLVGHYGDSALN
jgi:hypothetical protein